MKHTLVMAALAVLLSSCTTWRPRHEPHWPGYIVEPPSQAQLQKAYSAGWHSRDERGDG